MKLYNIIGVEKNASTQDIKKAYRKACLKGDYKHPDRGGDPDKFKILNEAHDILSNPEKRDVYDQSGMKGIKAES